MTTPASLPTVRGLGWSRHKKPGFNTRVAAHVSGREVRVPLWQYPLYEFEALYNGLTSSASGGMAAGLGASSLQALMGFFLQMQGQFGTFLYSDPDDGTVSTGAIATGDGTTQTFVIGRNLGGFTEPVSYVTNVSAVYFNGVSQAAGTWALVAPNTLAFGTAPGVGIAITATFTFAFQCRFLEDQLDFEEFMSALWKLDSLKFRSVKANTVAAPVPAPTVLLCSPSSGLESGGTPVTITGTFFGGATSVTFGGVAATSVVVVSSTEITCDTPAGSGGSVNIAVTTPHGTGVGANLYTYVAPATYSASYLIAGGGGGGGGAYGDYGAGGGGAGQPLTGTVTLTQGNNYPITVGAGGSAGTATSGSKTDGGSGGSSTFDSVTALGGGGGASDYNGGTYAGHQGGSGGGGNYLGAGGASNGTNTSAGGPGGGASGGGGGFNAGGGGGGSAVGGPGSANTGGAGLSSSITGSAVTYCGGGGGGGFLSGGGAGGSGGGGAGAVYTGSAYNGTSGTANTGGGGGGAASTAGAGGSGGQGGSGVVILSVPTAHYSGTTTGSPTVTTSGSNTILTFTSSGSYTA